MKLTHAKQLEGHPLHARDGTIGNVSDFYFDDHRWTIRYTEVETGEWMQSRKALIAQEGFRAYNWELKAFPVALTIEQVRNGPQIDPAKPVLPEHEEGLRPYYGWASAPNPALADGAIVPTIPWPLAGEDEGLPERPNAIPTLRSINATIGFHIAARDGAIGHAEDFVIDTENWRIRYVVVDTKNWLPARKVIVALPWIRAIQWDAAKIAVDLTREAIKGSPDYDATEAWNPDYGARLHDYYRHLRQVRTAHKTSSTRKNSVRLRRRETRSKQPI